MDSVGLDVVEVLSLARHGLGATRAAHGCVDVPVWGHGPVSACGCFLRIVMHILVACEDENSDGKLASGDGFRAGVAQAAGTTKNRETIALANDIAIRRRLIMRGGCYSNPNGLALVRAARRP